MRPNVQDGFLDKMKSRSFSVNRIGGMGLVGAVIWPRRARNCYLESVILETQYGTIPYRIMTS